MPSIDQRIVEMRFDNSQFERGASESLQTLRNLDKQINNATNKGLGNFANSLNDIDFSSLYRGISSITDKFSPIAVAGRRVVENLTDMAMTAVSKVTAGITSVFDTIETKGTSRAANLEQARFMLKGLTGDVKKVEKIISGPVNDAVTGTRFGLDEAAVAAANLYASGISDSEKLTKSLQAISGAATMTNKEYGDMSQIFSTIASNGFLMTMQVRQFSTYGMNILATLSEWFEKEKGIKMTEADIQEGLKDGLVTYDMFADAMYKYWDLAADANSTYSGSLANVNAQLGKIGEVVKSFEMQSLIPVNVAQINFLKALKGELTPIFDIINKRQQKKANFLKDFFEDERLMTAVRNVIRSITYVNSAVNTIAKDAKKAITEVFGKTDIMGMIVSVTLRLSNLALEIKKFVKGNRIFKDDAFLDFLYQIKDSFGSFKDTIIGIVKAIQTAFSNVFPKSTTNEGQVFVQNLADISKKVAETLGRVADWVNSAEGFNKLVDIFTNVFTTIKDTVDFAKDASGVIGPIVTQLIRALLNALKRIIPVVSDIFKVLGNGGKIIQKFLEALSPIVDMAKTIGTFVVHRFDELSAALDRLGETSKKAESNFSFFEFITNAMTGLSGAIQKVLKLVGKVVKTIVDAVDIDLTISFETFFTVLDKLIQLKIFQYLIYQFGIFKSTVEAVFNLFNDFGTIVKNFVSIPDSIGGGLRGLATNINQFTRSIKAANLLITSVALIALAEAVTKMAKVDAESAGKAVAAISTLLYATVGALQVLKSSGPGKGILMQAVAFTVMAGAVKKIAKALSIVADTDQDAVTTAGMILSGMMLVMTKVIAAMDGVKANVKSAIAITIFALALKPMAKALGMVADIVAKDVGAAWAGFAILELMLGSITVVAGLLSKMSKTVRGGKLIATAASIEMFVSALIPMVAAVAAITALINLGGAGATWAAFGMIEAMLASITVVTGLISKMTKTVKPVKMIIAVLSIKALVLSLIPMVAALAAITALIHGGGGEVVGAFIALELMMWSLVGVIHAISSITSGDDIKGMISNTGNMLSALKAINIMVKALGIMIGELTVLTGLMLINGGAVIAGLAVLETMMWSLVGVMAVSSKIAREGKDVKSIFTTVGAITLLILGMMPLVGAIAIFAALGAKSLIGLAVVEAVVWSLVGVVEVLKQITKKIRDAKKILVSVAMIAAIVAAITLILPQIAAISLLGPLALAGLIVFEAVLWSMVGVLAVLNMVAKNDMDVAKILAMSGAIAVMALSLAVLMPSLIALSALGTGALAGAGALAIILAAFVAAGAVAGNFPVIAAGLISLAVGIGAISTAFLILGSAVYSIGNGIQSLVDSIEKLSQLGDKIDTAFANILEAVHNNKGAMKTAMADFVDLAIESVKLGVPRLIRMAAEWVIQIVKSIHDTLPVLIKEIAETIIDVAKEISKNAVRIVTAAVDILVAITKGLEDNMERIVDCAFRIIISFIDGLADAIDKNGPKLKKAIMHLIKSIVGFIIGKENAKKFFKAAKKLIDGFVKGVKKWWANTKQAVSDFFEKLKAAWDKWTDPETYKQIAHDLIDGFVKGVKQKVDDAVEGIKNFGNKIIGGLKDILGIHSPSREFMKIGAWAVEGFIKGFEKNSKKAIKSVRKFAKDVIKDATKYSGNLMDEYNKHLDQQVYNEKQASYAKQNLKNLKAAMVEAYGYAKTSRKLTKDQTAELEYLQNTLIRDGELTASQFKKLGDLLGLSKKETKELYTELDSITHYEKAIKRYNDAWKEQTSILAEIEKMMDDGLFNVSFDAIKGSTDIALEAMEEFGVKLYQQTDEYKQNTAAIEANKEAIKILKDERKELKERMDAEKASIDAINDSLDGSYARRKSKLALDKEEQAQLDAIQTKMKNGQKLTNREIKLLGLYLGLSNEEIRVLKEQNKEGIANLAYKKTKAKLDKKQTAELEKLQKKLRKGKQLSEDELKTLGKLLGLSKEQIKNLVVEARERDKYAAALQKDKDAYEKLGDAIETCKAENKSLRQAIEDGAIPAFEELYNSVEDAIKNGLDPLNTALSDSIDLFNKFTATAVDVNLDDLLTVRGEDYDEIQGLLGQIDGTKLNAKIKKELQNADKDTLKAWASLNEGEIEQINMRFNKGLVDNISSFADTWEEYEEMFARLQAMGFNDLMIDRIKALGPAGLELIKSYLTFSDDEVKAANSAILRSTEATVDEWLTNVEDKGEKIKKFYDNLNVLRNSGLSNTAYQELLKQGADAAGAYVEALVNGPKENISRLNAAYKNMISGSEDLATFAMEGAAASGQKAGEAYRESFLSNFGEAFSDEEYKTATESMLAGVSKIVIDAVEDSAESEESKDAVTTAGVTLATYYVDGMSSYFDENGNLVSEAAGTMASNASSAIGEYISYEDGSTIGENMDKGIVVGVNDNASLVTAATRAVARAAYTSAVNFLAIRSPSKKFEEIGKYIDLGLVRGLLEYQSKIESATKDVAGASIDGLRETLMSLSEDFDKEANQPVIKPILDLSNVSKGAIEMKRMFESAHVKTDVVVESDDANNNQNGTGNSYQFVQNNYSPKALSRIELYRQTKNQFAMLKGATT